MECKNLWSARNDRDTVDTLVAQEVESGYLRGDSYYYYTRLCFGSRSSPYVFDTLSRAICWIAENNYEISIISHLLDDLLTVQPSNTSGHKAMALLTMIFNRLKSLSMRKPCKI